MLTLFKTLDAWIGTPICAVLGLFPGLWRRKILVPPLEARSILVVKMVALGDWVLILPVLKRIKDTFPEKRITVMASPRVAAIIENQPFIDEIIYIDPGSRQFGLKKMIETIRLLRDRQFDCVLELTHYYRFIGILLAWGETGTWVGFDLPKQHKNKLRTHLIPYRVDFHELENFMQFAGPIGADTSIPERLVPLPISSGEFDSAFSKLAAGNPENRPYILVHPGCSPASKLRYWEDEKWVTLVHQLIAKDTHEIVIVGGKDERRFIPLFSNPRLLNLIDKLSLKETCALMTRCDAYIGLDTGPTHLAAAHGASVLALFGPNTPTKWAPYGNNHQIIYSPPMCSPCIRQFEGYVPKRCSNAEDRLCMKSITVHEVMRSIYLQNGILSPSD